MSVLGVFFGQYGHVWAEGMGGVAVDAAVFEWTDQAAGFLRSRSWVVPGGLPGAFLLALQALSNASNTLAVEGPAVISPTPAGSGQYALCSTTAVLNFITGAGTGVQVTVPAPVASIFAADGVTVDPANVVVAAFIAAAVGYLTDSGGNVVTAYNTGVKSSRKVEQIG